MTNRVRDPDTGKFVKGNGQASIEEVRTVFNQSFASMTNVLNEQLASQGSFLERILDPRRDIDDECGYPKTNELTVGEYKRLYDREPIATRVVEVLPRESWQVVPEVFETEEMDEVTEFEKAFKELGSSIRGTSWYNEVKGNAVWEYLLRVDILSGIGSYGIILLGVNDGKELQEPLEPNENNELIFIRTLDRSLVDISSTIQDETNERFGHPEFYNATFQTDVSLRVRDVSDTQETRKVHWTRVIHIADNLTSSEIFGVPRQQSVYNRLYDLRKIYGADGETYWRNAVLKLFLETHPQMGGDVDVDADDMRSMMEQMMNGMQQWGLLKGMSAKAIAPAVVDPTSHVNAHIEAICINKGIPKRIFVGSERGELASSQDDETWNDRLHHRQNLYITPRVIVPFIDRLIEFGILPEPEEGYIVKWPDLNTLNDAQKAEIALKKTESLVKFIQGGGDALVSPLDFLIRYQDFTSEEAEAMLETTMERLQEEEEENIAAGLNPDGTPIIEEPEVIPQSGHLEEEKV